MCTLDQWSNTHDRPVQNLLPEYTHINTFCTFQSFDQKVFILISILQNNFFYLVEKCIKEQTFFENVF